MDTSLQDPFEDEARQEAEVLAVLEEFDPSHQVDILCNRYGSTWSVRPITTVAAAWFRDYYGFEYEDVPVERLRFSEYCVAVEQEEIVELLDALLDDGFVVV